MTSGPAVHPFLIEASIVAKSMGPGTRVPVSPTVKPRRKAFKISIDIILNQKL
jgi:hypothetical protein